MILLYLACFLSAAQAQDLSGQSAEFLSHVHSHNDYQQRHPLFDALDQNFSSVEADIWLKNDRLLVSHLGLFFKGSLDELYLDPLQAIVDRQGSVHGDGHPFYLWIELKTGDDAILESLRKTLERYPMLTVWNGDAVTAGPVTVILTGDERGKAKFVRFPGPRRACRDSNKLRPGDPVGEASWSWYSLKWSRYVRGNPRAALRTLVDSVHRTGRRLRLWNVPDNENAWGEAIRAGVDEVSVDDLSGMRHFLENLQNSHPG